MVQRTEQRVAVFIDAQNMYHSAKHIYGARVNFAGLVDTAAGSRKIIRAIAYVAKSKTGEESAFFEALTQNGIELKIKDVQEFASGQKKADWDVGMTVDAIGISARVDTVILATGDGDFVPLVHYLQAHGVRCEVVAFGASTNSTLREVADSFTDVSENPDQFLIHARGRRFEKRAPSDHAEHVEPSKADFTLAEDQPTIAEDDFLPEPQPLSIPSSKSPPPRRRGNGPTPPPVRKIRVTY